MCLTGSLNPDRVLTVIFFSNFGRRTMGPDPNSEKTCIRIPDAINPDLPYRWATAKPDLPYYM
jgi:hypothetical protein